MSSVQEIEAVLPRLSRAEIEEVRAWIDDFLEDQLELTDEVKAKLDQSRREIAEGRCTKRYVRWQDYRITQFSFAINLFRLRDVCNGKSGLNWIS